MTDRQLLTAGNVAELTARHRPAIVAVITRKVGDGNAAAILADLAIERALCGEWDDEKESFRSWALYIAATVAGPWQAPAHKAFSDVEADVDECMRDDYAQTWPQGERQRRLNAAMRETFSQPPYVDNDDYFA
jgi:hypothetical protein